MGEDFLVVGSRFNDGVEGFWVTGQLRLADGQAGPDVTGPASLAVAVGWAPTREEAEAAASALNAAVAAGDQATPLDLTGRLIADEDPKVPPSGADPQTMTSYVDGRAARPVARASRILRCTGSYLVADQPADGLTTISSPAPLTGSGVNWLNIFYAIEWAVFAGFRVLPLVPPCARRLGEGGRRFSGLGVR